MDGELDLPEYRVRFTLDEQSDEEDATSGPGEEDDKEDDEEDDEKVVLRVESARNVVVYSVMFVRTNVLENHELNFKESSKLFAISTPSLVSSCFSR